MKVKYKWLRKKHNDIKLFDLLGLYFNPLLIIYYINIVIND